MKMYHRTRILTSMIRIDFYTDADCTKHIGYSRFSNFVNEKLCIDDIICWNNEQSLTIKSFKKIDDDLASDTNVMWLDKIEIINYRGHKLFDKIIQATVAKIRQLLTKHRVADVKHLLFLEAYSLDVQFGPTTKKLTAIYRRHGFRTTYHKKTLTLMHKILDEN